MSARLDLVGSREIAGRLGVSIRTVQQWRYRQIFPEPEWVVSGQPIWRWATISYWAAPRGH